MEFILIEIAIIPIILLGIYIYKKDKIKEPSKLLLSLLIAGAISILPALLFEQTYDYFLPEDFSDSILGIAMSNFIGVALIEEICKWAVMIGIAYFNDAFDEFFDGLLYGVFVSLGFAGVENVLYATHYGLATALARCVLSVPSHVCNGIIMGYYMSKAKEASIDGNKKYERIYLLLSLLMPTYIHGAYDYTLTLGKKSSYFIFIILVIVIYTICFNMVKNISRNNTRFKDENKNNRDK